MRNFFDYYICIFLYVLLIVCVVTKTPMKAQTIKSTNSSIPASLSVFANDGDLTYCIATPLSNVQFSMTCRRNGITKFTSSLITENVIITVGDLCWVFDYDQANPKLVHFQVAENIKQGNQITTTIIKSQGDVLWP